MLRPSLNRLAAAARHAAPGAQADDAFALVLDHAACRTAPRALLSASLEATAALAAPGGGCVASCLPATVTAAATTPGARDAVRQEAAALLRAAMTGTDGAWASRVTSTEDRWVQGWDRVGERKLWLAIVPCPSKLSSHGIWCCIHKHARPSSTRPLSVSRAAARLPWLRELLGHTDGASRSAAARLIGASAAALLRAGEAAAGGSLGGVETGQKGVAALLSSLLDAGCGPIADSAGGGGGGSAKAGTSAKLEEQEGCILATGGRRALSECGRNPAVFTGHVCTTGPESQRGMGLVHDCLLEVLMVHDRSAPHATGFVAAQCRAILLEAALSSAVARLAALLPALERSPVTTGAAALALGYIGTTGPLSDLPTGHAARALGGSKKAEGQAATDATAASEQTGAAPAAAGASSSASSAAADLATPSSGAVLAAVASLLPATATIGMRESSASATAALGRVASALGLGCLGEGRPEVLRAGVKGEWGWWQHRSQTPVCPTTLHSAWPPQPCACMAVLHMCF